MQPITVENIVVHLQRLQSAPFIAQRDLLAYASYETPASTYQRRETVPVAKIISAPHVANWADVKDHRRTNAYLVAMIHAIQAGRLDLEKQPPILQEYGGTYFVTGDGITRCAVAKLLGMEVIPAEVTHIKPPLLCYAHTRAGYKTLLQRRKAGLWQGSLTVYRSSILRRFLRATGAITDYEGVWVFAKSMEQVKKIYHTVGAEGKE